MASLCLRLVCMGTVANRIFQHSAEELAFYRYFAWAFRADYWISAKFGIHIVSGWLIWRKINNVETFQRQRGGRENRKKKRTFFCRPKRKYLKANECAISNGRHFRINVGLCIERNKLHIPIILSIKNEFCRMLAIFYGISHWKPTYEFDEIFDENVWFIPLNFQNLKIVNFFFVFLFSSKTFPFGHTLCECLKTPRHSPDIFGKFC